MQSTQFSGLSSSDSIFLLLRCFVKFSVFFCPFSCFFLLVMSMCCCSSSHCLWILEIPLASGIR